MRKLIFSVFLLLLQSVALAIDARAPGPKVGWADVDGRDPLFDTAEKYCTWKNKDNTDPLKVFGIAPEGSPYPNSDEEKTCVEHDVDAQGNPVGLANYLFYVLKLRICPGGSELSDDKMSCNCPAGKVWFAKCVNYKPKVPDPNKEPEPKKEPEPESRPPCPSTKEPDSNPGCADPIYPGKGNTIEIEVDFRINSSGFKFLRTYNSNMLSSEEQRVRLFGRHWVNRFDSRIMQEPTRVPNAQDSAACYSDPDNGHTFCFDQAQALTGLTVPDTVSVSRPNGGRNLFSMANGIGTSDSDVNSRLSASVDGNNKIIWTFVDGTQDQIEKYSADGKLLSISSRTGFTQTLTYSTGASNDSSTARWPTDAPVCQHVQAGALLPAGRLLCVTDTWGKQTQFEYDTLGRVVKVISPDGQFFQYAYDEASGGCVTPDPGNPACSANNLTSVVYPGGNKKIYHYNESSLINDGAVCSGTTAVGNGFGSLLNSLTGITNENGIRSLSWGYSCDGMAIMSSHANGVEKANITYHFSEDGSNDYHDVAFSGGTTTNPTFSGSRWLYTRVLGVQRFVLTNGRCAGCPPSTSYVYDANGNVTELRDFMNVATNFTYDLSRNLEIKRTQGSGSVGLATTTSWHPTYRLPLQINQPLRRINFTYDAKGNVLTTTEQATNDTNGSLGANSVLVGKPRTWIYTYNSVGQVLTATGPRTDVVDKTTYAYDSQGNLSSVTNAAGHVTSMSNYDAHGRVGRITDANGLVTTLSYSERGWLTQQTTLIDGITETTKYQYSPIGKVTQVTMPDGSGVSFIYDDASRLIRISDSLGNSINYTLDLMGNRINETVTDKNGTLTRKISRIYDSTNNDLQSVIGGAQ